MSVVKSQIIYVTFKFQNLITDSVNMQIYHYDSKQLKCLRKFEDSNGSGNRRMTDDTTTQQGQNPTKHYTENKRLNNTSPLS